MRAGGLDAIACGNIGHPFPLAAREGHDALVVEASSFQLRFTETFHPRVSVLLNLAPDHLDWHGSFEARTSMRRRASCAPRATDDVHVGNRDDARSAAVSAGARARWSGSGSVSPSDGRGRLRRTASWCRAWPARRSLGPVGADRAGFRADAAAAAAASLAFGVVARGGRGRARELRARPHRGDVVALVDGVRFVDDSKATNVHAALAAIDGVARRRPDRRRPRQGRGPVAARALAPDRLAGVVAIGEAADEIASVFDGPCRSVQRAARSRMPTGGGVRARPAAGDGAARAGVRELGHVPRLRRARRPLRGRRPRA